MRLIRLWSQNGELTLLPRLAVGIITISPNKLASRPSIRANQHLHRALINRYGYADGAGAAAARGVLMLFELHIENFDLL